MVEPEDLVDLEEELEKKHVREGYQMGFEKGQEAGKDEGYSLGLEEGAKRGAEIGLYKGLTMTWIQLLNIKDTNDEELVDNFPKENTTFCEDKLNTLRVKFKQVTSMLDIKL